MKKAFPINLRIARKAAGYSNQLIPAKKLGLKRPTYQAYEEGRSFPPADILVAIADLYGISNLRGFIADEAFNIRDQDASRAPAMDSPLQSNYAKASMRDRNLVDMILGIGTK